VKHVRFAAECSFEALVSTKFKQFISTHILRCCIHAQAMLKGNDELLEHAKKRKVEAKIFELQEAMVERGYTDAEIEAKVGGS
jgi:hypothetical protein